MYAGKEEKQIILEVRVAERVVHAKIIIRPDTSPIKAPWPHEIVSMWPKKKGFLYLSAGSRM